MERFECNFALDGKLPPCDEQIARIYGYWCDIRPAGQRIPARKHLDPGAIPRLLPTIRLYDVHREPWRFRYRLFGTELVRMLGRDLTGTCYHDAGAGTARDQADLVFVAQGDGICYRRGFPVHLAPSKNHVTLERILLPLASDGRAVDMLLGFTVFHAATGLPKRRFAAA